MVTTTSISLQSICMHRIGFHLSLRFAVVCSLLVYGGMLPAMADDFARGRVYEDVNANGKYDSTDRLLPGVRVSNGVQIVRTNDQGRYSLPVSDDTTIFVIKPSGYRTPMTSDNRPVFFYHHKPAGSPDLKFKGIGKTGPLPESIDFPLYQQKEPEKFQVIFFGDPQPRNRKELDYIARDVIADLVGTNAAMGVTLGDILFNDLSLFEPNNQQVGLIGIPWYNVIGNHDINMDAKKRTDSNQTFEKFFGPTYYSFDYGTTHFIALDNIDWVFNTEQKRYGFRPAFGEQQLEFVRNDLAMIPKNQFVCLMMHVPVVGAADRTKLYELIQDRPMTISISGHTHHHEHIYLSKKHGFNGKTPHHHIINVTVSGSWWSGKSDERGIPHTTMADGAPNGYSIMSFDGRNYQLDFRAAGRPKDYQMRITMPSTIERQNTPDVYVNVFNGSEKTLVEFRVDQGPWKKMKKTTEPDPAYVKMHAEDQEIQQAAKAGKTVQAQNPALIGPKNCPHLWKIKWPQNIGAGTHLVTVKASNVSGKTYTGYRVIRVK